MISYQHRAYIAQALDSVLTQRRDFPIEIVISDDRSPDGTAAVIDRYQSQYPRLFRRLDPAVNVGMHANFARVWPACRGRYVALLEGDDFWHDAGKLECQVSFMEAHQTHTVCGHRSRVVLSEGGSDRVVGSFPPRRVPETTGFPDLIRGNYFDTCTLIFRAGIVPRLPDWLSGLGMGDWSIALLHALQGPIGFLEQALATRRMHAGGIWALAPREQQLGHTIDALDTMRRVFPRHLRGVLAESLMHFSQEALEHACTHGSCADARRHLFRHVAKAITTRRAEPRLLARSAAMVVKRHFARR